MERPLLELQTAQHVVGRGEDVNFLEQPSNHRRRYHLRPSASVRPSVSQSLTHSLMPSLPP